MTLTLGRAEIGLELIALMAMVGWPMAASENSSADNSAQESAALLPRLALKPRDEHFAVVVSGRPSRAGHTPFQIAIPKELYRRLRYESLGSTNQVMLALVRQALKWLDADALTLHAEAHPGPQPQSLEAARTAPDTSQGAARREFERGLDALWPNARLSVHAREDHRVVVQVERQPRADAQLTQIALPPEVHQRLLRDGIGATSQLVISLARYAMRRLDEESLTLEVAPADANAARSVAATSVHHEESEPAEPAIAGPSLTVAQLMHALSTQPPEAFVVFEEQADCWWDLQDIALVHLDTGNPYDDFARPGEKLESKTPIVVLSGQSSVIYDRAEDEWELGDPR